MTYDNWKTTNPEDEFMEQREQPAPRQPLDAKKLADEIDALRSSDDEYDFICNITSYHLRLFAQGLRALSLIEQPAARERETP